MSVYFVKSAVTNRIKIGFSASDPKRRLLELQSGCPEKLFLLASRPGDKADERMLHKKFAGARLTGEWFRMTGPLALEVALCDQVFARLAAQDQRLSRLAEECGRAYTDAPAFCANSVWYGYDGDGIKERLVQLVGWERDQPPEEMRTEAAYDHVYDLLYGLLPDCRGNCTCAVVLSF